MMPDAGAQSTSLVGPVSDTPDPEDSDAFERRARAFLSEQAGRFAEGDAGRSEGLSIIADSTPEEEARTVVRARAWRRTLFENGFGWIDGPRAYGGGGRSRADAERFQAMQDELGFPDQSCFLVGLSIVAPAIVVHGSAEQKQKYLPGLFSGSLFACQLFSEPGNGSDLAGITTAAERDGDRWIVNGQKVWNSGAQFSDIGLLLARTDRSVPKHRGLTMFLIDMRQPGVEVRPLRQMTGGAHFNEVFLTDAVIPDDDRLAKPGEGWRVAITTLMSEREAVGASRETPPREVVDHLVATVREHGARPALRDDVVRAVVLGRVLEMTSDRLGALAGSKPGPEMSILKLMRNDFLATAVDAGCAIVGPGATAGLAPQGLSKWGRARLALPGLRIAGGTDEIQRNILSERVLGLPRDPKP